MGAIGALGNAINDAIAPPSAVAERRPYTARAIRALLSDKLGKTFA